MRHVVARGHASASTHSHSHRSGSYTGGSGSSITYTPGPAPVDQALYQMDPYGYAAHPGVETPDIYGSYPSPYGGGYYDYDPTVAGGVGDGTHGM